MPAGRLIPLLARSAGANLTCSDELAADVLLLQVKDRPLDEVLAKLAKADSAEWLPAVGGFRFSRSPEMVAGLRRKELSRAEEALWHELKPMFDACSVTVSPARAQEVVRARARLRESDSEAARPEPAKPKPGQETPEDRLRRLDSLHPDVRFSAKCLRDIGVARIAAMETGDRLVYSTDPTSMQRALSRRAMEWMLQYRAELTVWNRARERLAAEQAARAPAKEKKEDEESTDDDDSSPPYGEKSFIKSVPEEPETDAPRGPAARVLVMLTCTDSESVQLDIEVLDARNHKLLSLQSFDLLSFSVEADEEAGAAPAKNGPMVELSPVAALFTKTYSQAPPWSPERSRSWIDPSLLEQILRPEQHDPLDRAPADGFRSAAKAKALNLAVCLTDDLLDYLTVVNRSAGVSVPDFLADAKGYMQLATEDGWLLGGPTAPLRAQRNRVPRAALGGHFRAIWERGRTTIEERATLQSVLSDDASSAILDRPRAILTGERPRHASQGTRLLGLYGWLSQLQRDRLLSGSPVSYGSLSIPQRRLANRLIYGSQDDYTVTGREGPPWTGDLEDEQTLLAPNGLIPACGIRARKDKETWVQLIDPTKSGRGRVFATVRETYENDFAEIVAARKAPTDGYESLLCEVRTVTRLHLEADICPWRWLTYDYFEEPDSATEAPVPQSKLPADLHERVKKAIERFREESKWGLPSEEGNPTFSPPETSR